MGGACCSDLTFVGLFFLLGTGFFICMGWPPLDDIAGNQNGLQVPTSLYKRLAVRLLFGPIIQVKVNQQAFAAQL